MAEPNPNTDYFSTFIGQLDPAGRATLRRSLAFPPGSWPPAFPYVEHFVATTSSSNRKVAYLVAGLQASSRATSASGNFGDASERLQRATNSGSVESRFITVLDADETALYHHLRQMVTLMASHGIAPDWARLRRDLNRWHDHDRTIQLQWARSFYRNQLPAESEINKVDTSDQEETTS